LSHLTRRLVPSAVALVTVAALAGCSTCTVQGADVSKRISEGLEKEVGQRPNAVRCPPEIEAKPGAKARCTIVGSDGREIGLTVTMKDERGKFDYGVDREVSKQPTKKAKR
jgi:Domain of unknown function (DUF4333)